MLTEQQPPPPFSAAIYDPDPNHLWNRLFVAFYRQKLFDPTAAGPSAGDDPWVGPDLVDPPLGYHPRFLLADEPFAKCDALLDEFLDRHAAGLIHDPLKRALLQRDLWAVFDVLTRVGHAEFMSPGESARWAKPSAVEAQRQVILERKLARAIRSLALACGDIESLPDTYAAAIQSGAFSDLPLTNRYDFLPHDLFAARSGWQELLPDTSKSRKTPKILVHTAVAGGRSVFRAFVKLPADSRNVKISYDTLPYGTQYLLLREMICLDENLRMVPTHVVESVQFRIRYLVDSAGDPPQRERGLAREAELSRALLFQGRQGGLRPVPKGELRIQFYEGLGHLRVDEHGNNLDRIPFPLNCIACHPGNGLLSRFEALAAPDRSVSIEPTARWKEKNGKLDVLRALILAPASAAK